MWTVFAAFVVALIGIVIVGAISLTALAIMRSGLLEAEALARLVGEIALSRDGLLLGIAISALVLTTIALLGARLSPTPITARLRLGPAHTRAASFALLALGTSALGFTAGIIVFVLGVRQGSVLGTIDNAMKSASVAHVVLAFALIGVAGPVAEELFFRGYTQTRLRERWGAWPAILITSAAFGLFHMDVAQGITAAALGVYMGWAVEETGSIRPAILMHVTNNVLATSLSLIPSKGEEGGGEDTAALLVFAALCAAIAGGAAWLFRRARRASASRLRET